MSKKSKTLPVWQQVLGGLAFGGVIIVVIMIATSGPDDDQAAIDAYRAARAHYVDLREAVKWGTLNDVKDAAEDGGDFDARDGLGETPLHWVARNTKAPKEITRLVLKHVDDINVRDDAGKTPLHLAAEFGNSPAAEVLLKEGADPCLRDDTGKIPYDRAVFPSEQRELSRVGLQANCN